MRDLYHRKERLAYWISRVGSTNKLRYVHPFSAVENYLRDKLDFIETEGRS